MILNNDDIKEYSIECILLSSNKKEALIHVLLILSDHDIHDLLDDIVKDLEDRKLIIEDYLIAECFENIFDLGDDIKLS